MATIEVVARQHLTNTSYMMHYEKSTNNHDRATVEHHPPYVL